MKLILKKFRYLIIGDKNANANKQIYVNGAMLGIVILAPLLAGPTFKSFRIPTDNSQPREIALGPDGNMWFTKSEFNVSQIGRIDP